MKIVNVRDGFVKIEANDKVSLLSFLQINSTDKNYIAQVIQQKENGSKISIYAKILYLYINGMLVDYDKTIPGFDAEIEYFSFNIIEKMFSTKNSIVVGKFLDDKNIKIDKSFFNNKFLLSIDSPSMINIITTSIEKQFILDEKVIIIDTLGVLEGVKYVAGRDFRLPINKDSLKFIYEDCLKDATVDSKKMIKEIFFDLINYSENIDFVPFDVLKSIIDHMVDKEHIFKLMILKNKLEYFKKMGYFASNYQDAKNLNNIIKSNSVIIDISKLDVIFQNRYLELLYSEISKLDNKTKIIITVSNNINKGNLKNIILNECLSSIFITHSKFKYLKEIKTFFNTYILEPTYANKNLFNKYSLLLNSIKKDEYLIVGEGTSNIPLVSKQFIYTAPLENEKDEEKDDDLKNLIDEYKENNEEIIEEDLKESNNISEEKLNIDDIFKSNDEEYNIKNENNEIEKSEITFETAIHVNGDELNEIENDSINLEEEKNEDLIELISDEIIQETDIEEIKIDENIDNKNEKVVEEEVENIENVEEIEEIGEVEEIEVPENLSEDVELISTISEAIDDNIFENIEIENNNISQEEYNIENNEIEEINDNNYLHDEEIISIDITNEEDDILNIDDENLEKEILEDVDKVFTEIKEDSILESDLDFIDELNELGDIENLGDELAEISDSDNLIIDENDILTEIEDEEEELLTSPIEEFYSEDNAEKEILEKKSSTTTIVPVYEAEIAQEDKVLSDKIEQGDTVIHAKYGTGIVEKMIKYGNKDLYSINFDNIGRRLLDPLLTEIKKA